MKKMLCVVLCVLLMAPAFACAQEVVNVFNWEDYIDEDVLTQFEEETGIHVNYMRFTTNEDMLVQVEANPGAFDVVLSLNGFHAFPEKEAAYREVFRVLKPGGTFCGCFYVAGEQKRTDWFVRHIYEKAGFFTPPYETAFSLKKRLEKMYAAVTLGTVKSMAWFVCRKENQ